MRKARTKKLVSAVLCALVAFGMAACGNKTKSTSDTASSAVYQYTAEDVVSAVEAVNKVSDPREIDSIAIQNDFGIEPADVIDYSGKVSNDPADSAQILAVECADGKTEEVKGILSTYQKGQIRQYAAYDKAQSAVQNGRIVVDGDYVILIFANSNGADYAKIDKALASVLVPVKDETATKK